MSIHVNEIRELLQLSRPDFVETALSWQPPFLTQWEQICADRTATLHNLLLERDWSMCQQLIEEWQTEEKNGEPNAKTSDA